LREALGDSAASPLFIETLARRGYRFTAAVEAIAAPIAASASAGEPANALPLDLTSSTLPRRRAVRRSFAAAGALTLLLASPIVWNSGVLKERLRGERSSQAVRSLAVLPLENFSGDPAQDYLADSMTDQIITELAGIRALRVTSRTSVMRFKAARKPLREIAEDLNVDAIVTGSLVRSGQRVRITAQLIHASSDKHLWAQSYEGSLSDVLTLEREAALAIARQIQIQITPQETARLTNSMPVDAEAQDAYFQGRFYSNGRTKEGLEKAIRYYEQAIARAPNYAQAYSGLADSYVLLGYHGFLAPREAYSRAKTEALKALALDNTLAEAHAAPAYAGLYYDWDWASAERGFRHAIELNANYVNAHHWYSHFLIAMGRPGESLEESRRCIQLDPLNPVMVVHLGWHYLYAHEYDKSIEYSLHAIEADPGRYLAEDALGRAYEQKGMHAQAVHAFERAVAVSKEGSAFVASLGAGYAAAGRRDDAIGIVNRLKLESRHSYVPAYGLAEIYAALGDKEKAFVWLERAYEERSSELVYLKVEPRLDGLRSDFRFQDLLRRMRLGS
jgi:TolB-like protein